MNQEIPNDSMSCIHVADLASLAIGCLLCPEASGRYFAVVESFPWHAIMDSIKKAKPDYVIPAKRFDQDNQVTLFDVSRRDSICKYLGIQLRGLDDMVDDTIKYLQSAGEL